MQTPVQITYQDVVHTPTIEELIQKKAHELERYFSRITSCRVCVRAPHKHSRTNGSYYHVTVELAVPGAEIVAGRDPGAAGSHDDLQIAIRDAFRAVKRQLQDHVHRLRREVKNVVAPPHARVVRIFPYEGFGFLVTGEGQEVYFHRNSVLHGAFETLQVGDEVRFAAEQGENGLQASTVASTTRHLLPRENGDAKPDRKADANDDSLPAVEIH